MESITKHLLVTSPVSSYTSHELFIALYLINTLIYHIFTCNFQLINAINLHYCHRIKIFFIKRTIDQFCFLPKRTSAHLELKKTKNITHLLLLKGQLALSVQFCIMNNFAELQRQPMMEFFFNTLPRQFLIASLLKSVSDFTADVFFVRKGAFQLNISTKKYATKDRNIKILKI